MAPKTTGVFFSHGHQGVGAGGSHHGDFGFFSYFSADHGQKRSRGTNDADDFFLGNKPFDCIGRFNRLRFIVNHKQFNFLSKDLRHGFMGHLNALQLQLSAIGSKASKHRS